MFSAPIYIRGSVQNYATLLKLDVPQIMAALDAELKRHGKIQRAAAAGGRIQNPARPRDVLALQAELAGRSGRRRRVGSVVVVLLRRLGVAASSRSNPLAGLPPAVYQSANSGDTLPLPKN